MGWRGGRYPTPPDPNKLTLLTTKNMLFLKNNYALNCRILRFVLNLCRKRASHHNFWFHKSSHFAATFTLTLKHLIKPRRVTWFHLTPSWVWIFRSHTSERVPHRTQPYSLFHRKPSLQSQTCNKPVYHQKAIKFTYAAFFRKNMPQEYSCSKN